MYPFWSIVLVKMRGDWAWFIGHPCGLAGSLKVMESGVEALSTLLLKVIDADIFSDALSELDLIVGPAMIVIPLT